MSGYFGPAGPVPPGAPQEPVLAPPGAGRRSARAAVGVAACAVTVLVAVIAFVLAASAGTTTAGHGTALAAPSEAATEPAHSAPASGDGVLVTSRAGRFRVRMPQRPIMGDQPGSFGDVKFVVHTASVRGPDPVIVAVEDIESEVPAAEYRPALRAAVGSFAGASGLSIDAQRATTFQGHPGRTAQLTSPVLP